MANVKDVTTIADETKRAHAEKVNILCAKDYIMNRTAFKNGADFIAAVTRADEAASNAEEKEETIMAEQKNIMSYETVALDDEQSALVILDQTKLPSEVEVLHLTEQKDIWDAIYLLKVRGAPAIGVAGGFACIWPPSRSADNYDEFYAQFKKAKEYLDSSRRRR